MLAKLCCPFDKSDLSLEIISENDQHEVAEGILTCSSCNRYFPIIYGLPIMSPDEYRETKLEAPVLAKWGKQIQGTATRPFHLTSLKAIANS